MQGVVDLERLDAVLFDLDGVVTDTASVHAAAWKQVFDAFLERHVEGGGEEQPPFDLDRDYSRYVDGRPRHDGITEFLRSRGISLPPGSPADAPERETVGGIGNRKNAEFRRRLEQQGVEPFASTVALLRSLRERGIRTAVFSASRNCAPVLRAAGVDDLFDARVDGIDAAELGLPGKPDPATLLEAARRVGTEPRRAAIVEDAIAGVEAGRRGRFALVIGIDRSGHAEELRAAGADLVVADLGELAIAAGPGSGSTEAAGRDRAREGDRG